MRSSPIAFGVAVLGIASWSPVAARYSAPTNYVLHCQGCHGADGVGLLPDEVPPLRGSVGWFLRVPGGRAYLAQVPGASQAPVDDAELAELLNYTIVRFSAAEAGADFEPYTREEVARVRRARPDIVALRQELVSRIRERFGVSLWGDGYRVQP